MTNQPKPLPPPRVVVETARWCLCRNCQLLVAEGSDPFIVWTPRVLPPFDAAVVERLARAAFERYEVVTGSGGRSWDEHGRGYRSIWSEVAISVLLAALGEGVVTG